MDRLPPATQYPATLRIIPDVSALMVDLLVEVSDLQHGDMVLAWIKYKGPTVPCVQKTLRVDERAEFDEMTSPWKRLLGCALSLLHKLQFVLCE